MRKYLPICFIAWLGLGSGIVSAMEADSAVAGNNSKLPVLMVSKGVISFIGDVGYSHLNEPLLHQGGFQVSVQFSVKSRLSPSVYFLHGSMSGSDKNITRSVNFKTSFNSIGVLLNYQLISMSKRQVLVPYFSAG